MMILEDIIIHITGKGADATTKYICILFSLATVIGIVLAIFINTKRGERPHASIFVVQQANSRRLLIK